VSEAREWKVVHPQHEQSGIDVFGSDFYRVADLTIHVKGTNNPLQNSDTDLVVQYWNIWHFRQGWTSQATVTFGASDRLWVPAGAYTIVQTDGGAWVAPLGPSLSSPDGQWDHYLTSYRFHLFASQYYATLAGTITIGIDHIPEPASLALVGLGVGCALMGVRSRRQRRS
jgi:hypothetical protein